MTKHKATTPSRFWKPRATRTGKARIEKAEHLWRAACRYFDWTENTPLKDMEAIKLQGEVTVVEVPKMRLRANQNSWQKSAFVVVESAGDGRTFPCGVGDRPPCARAVPRVEHCGQPEPLAQAGPIFVGAALRR